MRQQSTPSFSALLPFAVLLTVVGCDAGSPGIACVTSSDCPVGEACVDAACRSDGGGADAGVGHDGGSGDGSDGGGLGAFCAGAGSLVVSTDRGDRCTGELAQTSFRYAVCSCGEFTVSNTFRTDSFDSIAGAYDPLVAGTAGAFGTNGDVSLSADAMIGGSAWVHGSQGIVATPVADLAISGHLRVGGPVDSAASVLVDLDAEVAGDVSVEDLTVAGTLVQPAGATLMTTTQTLGGQASGVVEVAPPCECGDDSLIDVAGLVADFALANDNAAAGFDPSVLEGHGSGAVVDLPCGRLYAPTVSGAGPLTLRVAGRTALFIGGDLSPSSDFTVEIVGGGELDLFVAGNLISASSLNLGTAAAPSSVRLYIGGDLPIALSGGGVFAGNVYAPHARFTMSTAIEIYGALFAHGIVASDTLTVHYDEAILDAGEDCTRPPDPGGCESCVDCANQACNAGTCGSCATDSDCCSPLICAPDGSCVPPVIIG